MEATPAKGAFGVRLVMDDASPITPAASLTRSLLRAADFPAFLDGSALVAMLLRHDCERLGDIAAGSMVVYEARPVTAAESDDVPAIVPARPLAPGDQAAVIASAARAPRLTGERLADLAALAAAVPGDAGRSGPEVMHHVPGIVQGILGRR